LSGDALQGDVAFADVLGRMGAEVTWHDDAVTVAAGERLVGIDVDMEPISDTVPTLAVVAACAEGPTTIRGVGFIRATETDRIAAPVAELRRCGVDAEATDDGMVIRPAPLRPATFDTYRDHRMAMALALLGLVAPGMAVRDPGCVAKTFPGYWRLLDELRAGALPPARAGAGGAG
ncbi:MAG: 3-phosphoshikimate 1-carboxyvinyltransferase, partial [Acidimicrobiia bacterium]